ncbi:putative glycerol uptake facilitator [Philodulcilactobacillus myokoensis]|uniref:Glycerol uptake facilitator n=1 Tax=Philodulcilactobacillus myokoensis TaxID=2929573 RepID=A0A9W6B060_9LACO|nr:aquaporin [Philodulcilactobacillus myokoensis]GLB46547.1 putative glycerol uptake facilitator [Philodulcilactobacillus myokoensis]
MKMIIGEFIGTYLMLALGLGISLIINYLLYPRLQNRYITGLYWGISILIASLISTGLWGTANFNPVFSFTQAAGHQITWPVMIGETVTQIIGAWLASKTVEYIWSKYLYTLPINLNFFATVPRDPNKNLENFLWEFFGTLAIIVNAQIMNDISIAWWIKTIWSSVLMTILITVIAPITGAALNPTRDLIPRTFFSHMFDKSVSEWSYAKIPLLAPISAGIVALIFKAIMKYLHL